MVKDHSIGLAYVNQNTQNNKSNNIMDSGGVVYQMEKDYILKPMEIIISGFLKMVSSMDKDRKLWKW